jgi:flavin-dependent dehydrogenase
VKPYDVVIVGGGPAGLSTALHLAEKPHGFAGRTLVLEKERYPRDKICAGAIGGRGLEALARIGVTIAVPHETIRGMSFAMAGARWSVWEDDIGIVVRRIEFDHALAREAMRRGIEVQDGVAVKRVEATPSGVRVTTSEGVLEARAVVGADGVAGVVRRSLGLARGRLRAQAVEVDTERAPGDLSSAVHFDFSSEGLTGYAWDFPTVIEGQRKMSRGVYRVLDGRRDDARERLRDHLGRIGLDLAGYEVRQFAERGFEPGDPMARPSALLVGEAAGIDILSGEGIAQAIQYGALAALFLTESFRAGDLTFEGWTHTVHASQLGRQLRRRLVYQRLLYNRARPDVERAVRRIPSAIRMAMQEFGGKPVRGFPQFAREVLPALVRHGPAAAMRLLLGPW